MPDAKKLSALLEEYHSLDRTRDAARVRQVLSAATIEVDRVAAPKKWAALYSLLGQSCAADDPRGALDAFRHALQVWTPDEDHDNWVECHSGAGMALFSLQPLGPDELDEAISHLEAAALDQPFLAQAIAFLYAQRQHSDPLENWRKRMATLEQALAQISKADETEKWANAENALAVATAEQPDGDFLALMAKRRARHYAALEALGEQRNTAYVETCMYLSEVHLFGVVENIAQNHRLAEELAARACEAARALGAPVLTGRAMMARGRALASCEHRGSKQDLKQAQSDFSAALALFRAENNDGMAANALALNALNLERLIALGETNLVDQLADEAESAVALLDPSIDGDRIRTILQPAGEALLRYGQPARAVGYLERAVAYARKGLAEATTPEGRIERIWAFRDSSALLSYCYLRLENKPAALQALEDGKSRFWIDPAGVETWEDVSRWIPKGGALLFPNFAADPGAVVIVSELGSKCVWLSDFGRSQLLTLQRGAVDPKELGGWLKAYSFRNSQLAAWVNAIDAVGAQLYHDIWIPVIAAFDSLGVGKNAELVWFPQGGSGVFPVHAAWHKAEGNRFWLLDEYCIRYAPSLKALAAAKQPAAGKATLVVNPRGDLGFSEFEGIWALRQTGVADTQVFARNAAVKPEVLAAIADTRLLHLATHAAFDWTRPLDSRIELAGSDALTLAEVLPHLGAHPPELVVLSACETGITRVTSTPDEFLGFSSAFLHGGVRCILSTLWPVDDLPTALLMRQFYQTLLGERQSPVAALRRAQNWLRTVAADELIKILGELRDEPDPVGRLASDQRIIMRGWSRDFTPYSQPFFWAAFTLSGN